MSLACYRVPVRYKTILLHNTVYDYSWFSSLLFLCVFELISSLLVVNREVVRQEAERGRGDPVRDRPKAEASDGFGGCQRTAEASRLDHWVECGLWVLHRLQWLCCLNWRSSNEVSHFHKAGWADGSKKKKKRMVKLKKHSLRCLYFHSLIWVELQKYWRLHFPICNSFVRFSRLRNAFSLLTPHLQFLMQSFCSR